MMNNPREIALEVAKVLDSKKAVNIVLLEVAHLTVVADCFVIASGRSANQVKALAHEVEDKMAELGLDARRREGYQEGRWIVLDYASVLVHIFHEQEREYYNIERLWMDGSNQIPFEPQPDGE
ncbi:MAG TPA: ribosome silencing factor [Candidatus Faecaligallichristensenella faecipullorum]|nr:ribosome silencing factor [Candidatus Faecaligallichristensenella faecipullorum]